MDEATQKDEELDLLLKQIKAKHKANTRSTNLVILTCIFVLGVFFLYSAVSAANERANLESVVEELKDDNGQLSRDLNATQKALEERFLSANEKLELVENRLLSASEELNRQQEFALREYSFDSRNRIEDLEIHMDGVTDLRGELNSIHARLDDLEEEVSNSRSSDTERGAGS